MRAITTILALVALSGTVLAHSGATGVVKARMAAMGSMADAMKVLVPMVRGQAAYDPAGFAAAARAISAEAGQPMIDKFPAGSLQAPSEAAPAIWEEFARFSELALSLQAQADTLAEAALAGEALPKAEFAAMAGSCAACHEEFRVETK